MNGKPHSLFLGGNCYPHGIVGVALVGKGLGASGEVVADGTRLGTAVTVTKARGNIILEVNDRGNPTQHLLDGIKQRGFAARKDEQFYVSVGDVSPFMFTMFVASLFRRNPLCSPGQRHLDPPDH